VNFFLVPSVNQTMSEQGSYRATILPVPEGTPQPLWSVMIPTYNCAEYLRQTLSSVLAQDPGAELMQIAVIDDCSTKDDPEAIVQELGQGRVEFYRQPQNVGHTKNFQSCLERSRGQLIHLLHGDDYVLDGYYRQMQQAFMAEPSIGAAFCRHVFMDEQGHWYGFSELLQSNSGVLENWLERILTRQYIQTPSIVVRRKVYEQLGGFDQRLVYYEDWEMWVRIATQYPIWYESQTLAVYRTHSASNSGRRIRTGENIQDVRRGTEIVQAYLPAYLTPDRINQLISKNHEITAHYALDTAQKLLLIGDVEGGIAQLREALRCSHSVKVLRRAIRLLLKAGLYQIRRTVARKSTFSS
jgi:GT2 family glycosyltransferase